MNTATTHPIEDLFDKDHQECDHCQSVFSPAAYLVKLLESLDKYIQPKDALRKRRPDLYTIKLDCENTLEEKPYLEIVNEILLTRLDAGKGENEKLGTWLKPFALNNNKLPFFLRKNFPLMAIRAYLNERKTKLEGIYKIFKADADTLNESLNLSKEEYERLLKSDVTESYLKEIYGTDDLKKLAHTEVFIRHTGIEADKLPELLEAYNTIEELLQEKLNIQENKEEKISIDAQKDETITTHVDKNKKLIISKDHIENLGNDSLYFLHIFITLSRALGWNFESLAYVFRATGAKEMQEDVLKKIASIHQLEQRFSKDLKAGYKEFVLEEAWHPSVPLLYLSEAFFKEKIKKTLGGQENYDKLALVDIHDLKGSDQMSVLQGILGLSADELNALIDYQRSIYPEKTAVESLLQDFYAQRAMNQLMGISIEELLGLMDLLNNPKDTINLLSPADIHQVITRYKELEPYSVSARGLIKLLKGHESIKERYAEPIKAIKEAIDQINPWDISSFFNVIQPYFTLNKDLFVAIVAFSEKRTDKSFEKPADREALLLELIIDMEIFSALALIDEDINHITNHYDKVYKFEGGWDLKAIQKLLYYRELKGLFSKNALTLSQYIGWIYSEAYNQEAILEKITQLSGWDKQTLGELQKDKHFKESFAKEKNPIEALKKIQSFMDLVGQSGLNAKVLIELNGLYHLSVDSYEHWKKFTDAAEHLASISAGSGEIQESFKNLLEQKRDLLSGYMIYKNEKLKNMRHLYADLLIDVEMSACSKISPLKAALNSTQLYLHRCVMHLEEGTQVDQALSGEYFELLSHYRKWEASQKIQLYPENYLNPTLRKIASPEYKKLQNTLMQGNITEEALEEAYLEYFDDFQQVASLEIIDSYFELVADRHSGGEKKPTIFFLGRSPAQPYEYYYCTGILDSEHQKISYWTPWQKIQAAIPADVDTATLLYAFNRLFVFWVGKTQKKEPQGNTGNPNFKEQILLSIHYVFQKVEGTFSPIQTLLEQVEVPKEQAAELSWQKPAAFSVKDKEEKKYILVSIGEVERGENKAQHFIIDETLKAQKKGGLSIRDAHNYSRSLNTKLTSDTKAINVDDEVIFYKDVGKGTVLDVYNIKTDSWSRSEKSPIEGDLRSNPAVAVLGKKIVFFPDYYNRLKINSKENLHIYNLKTKKWEEATRPENYNIYSRSNVATAVVRDRAIFLGGGHPEATTLSTDITIYNAQTNSLEWPNDKDYFPVARMKAATVVVGNKAIFLGGILDNLTYSSAIDIYDDKTGKWTTVKDYTPEARDSIATAVIGNKAIFFGGWRGGNTLSSAIDIYDNTTGNWSTVKNHTPQGRAHALVALVGNKAIFFGGRTGENSYSSAIDIYDDKTGEWTTVKDHKPEARDSIATAVIGNKAIFFGGRTGENSYSSAIDIYDDKTGQWRSSKIEGIPPFKKVTSAVKDNEARFIGIDKDGNAQVCLIRASGSYTYFYFYKESLKLLANSITRDLLYTNFSPGAKICTDQNSNECKNPLTLLENYSKEASGPYPIRNYPDGAVIKSEAEVFLCLSNTKAFPLGITPYLFYDEGWIEFKNYESDYEIPTKFTFLSLNMPEVVSILRQITYAAGPQKLLAFDTQKEYIKPSDFSRLQPTDKVIVPDSASLFQGAHGLYLWEIFFHTPTLAAWYLNSDEQFSIARKWQQYILDPTQKACDIWRFLPFREECYHEQSTAYLKNTQTIQTLQIDPLDPYSIAAQRIISFEKYIVISYIENLLAWADMLFGQGSWESLNEATMLYIRAWDLLGAKPIKKGKRQIEPKSYDQLKGQRGRRALDLEKALSPDHPNEVPGAVSLVHRALGMADYEDYFCTPENEEFVGLWEKLQDRLYKIRHCLDIKGKPYVPALFEPAIDPKQLVLSAVEASGGGGIAMPEPSVPLYRFSYIIGYAKSTLESVIGLGAELLSVMEKKDAESLSVLYNRQEALIAALITPIKEKAIEALKEEHNALNEGLNHAQHRKGYYDDLISKALSGREQASMDLSSSAIDSRTASSVLRGAAVAAHLIPTIYGFSIGGFQPGSSVEAAAGIADSAATVLGEKSQMTYTRASYERRAQEWSLQRDMAGYDTKQIAAQIEANLIYQGSAEKELQAYQKSIEQMKEKKDFFEKKFTKEELYGWMKAQIASIYFQGYKLALRVAKQTEKTYQYELNTDEVFVTSNGWNSLKEGLLAGHHLKFALERMHAAYHEKNERHLEISKNISLKEINQEALNDLKTKGECIFHLNEKLFDEDFPGHYNRKIKALRMTIPAVVGPYENIHASLQQTANKTVLKAEGKGIDAVKFLLGEKGASDPNDPSVLRSNVKLNQQIALSRGNQDSGLFELNFNDERYLPFEGTGAISDWTFSLPKENNRFDIQSISDVIIHLDYTASDGGKPFREEVKKLVSKTNKT